jgi:hypothetical protein
MRFIEIAIAKGKIMKKTIAIVAVAAAALAASPAAAQTSTTGTVNVTGVVGGRCSVVQPGGNDTQTFTGAIDLQRLDAADGTLRSTLTGSTAATPADNLKVATRVVCTAANPSVGILATRLNTGGQTDPGTGYSNDIDYTAQVRVNRASGGVSTVSYSTLTGGATATTQALGERIAAGGANNVEVSVFGLRPEGGATSLLAEGTYTSTVSVYINPSL